MLEYLEHTAPGFKDFADLIFVVDSERLPVHSQLLARESCMIADLLRSQDQPPTWQKPFVFEMDTLFECDAAELLLFLSVVYRDAAAPATVAEACAVHRLADFFNAPRLLESASTYLQQRPDKLLTVTVGEDSPVRWLLVAQRLRLEDFAQTCIKFTALHFNTMCEDPRLKDLSASTLLDLLQEVHRHARTGTYGASQGGSRRHPIVWTPAAGWGNMQ